MIRNIITGAALAVAVSIGAARAEDVLVTTLQPGGGEISLVVARIEAVQPRGDGASCFVLIGGRNLAIATPYVQVLDLLAGEAPGGRAGRVIRGAR